MAQLKMYWMAGTPIKTSQLPEGYTISQYRTPADKLAWCACCKNGLIEDDAGEEAFDRDITARTDICPERDVFFIDYQGEHIGTVTAYVFHRDGMTIGDMHMVGIRTDFRGRGLAKYLAQITLGHLASFGVHHIELTTDEWRKGAVKSYLNAGFHPVEYDTGMVERWENELEAIGVDAVEMLRDDTTPFETICRTGLKAKA